jgi:hypothetical protein
MDTPNVPEDKLMLEVIDKGSRSEAHPAPLLFVHGGPSPLGLLAREHVRKPR